MPIYKQPTFNEQCNVWEIIYPYPATPVGPPRLTFQRCARRQASVREVNNLHTSGLGQPVVVFVFPINTVIYDWVGRQHAPGNDNLSIIEYPAGSGVQYYAAFAQPVAVGYPNAHLNVMAARWNNTPVV